MLVLLVVVVAMAAILALENAVYMVGLERVANDQREQWLEARWAGLLEGAVHESRLAASAGEAHTVQLWELTAGGETHYDVVVWKETHGESARVLHTFWVPSRSVDGFLGPSFRDGFFFYNYNVARGMDEIFAPEVWFDLFNLKVRD